MKIIKNLKLFLFLAIMMCFFSTEEMKAATSYTDAKTFYDTCTNTKKHVEIIEDAVYYANKASVGNPAYKRFTTIGWQVRLTGLDYETSTEHTISMDFKIDGSYLKKVHSKTYSDGYNYALYRIDYKTLCEIAEKKEPTKWNAIKDSSELLIRLDAIITWKPGGSNETVSAIVSEDGKGNVSLTNEAETWYLSKSQDLAKARANFPRQTFQEFYDVKEWLNNYGMNIYYYAGYIDAYSETGYMIDSASSAITGRSSVTNKGSYQKFQRFQTLTLMDPVGDFGLKKRGYKIIKGNEWRTTDKTSNFNVSTLYFASDVNPLINYTANGVFYLVANWEPINYKITYKANTGVGQDVTTDEKYDKGFAILSNPFSKPNYVFTGWNTKADGSGVPYNPEQSVINLSETDGDVIVLYAQWKTINYRVNISDSFGTGGTTAFYEVYGNGFTSDAAGANPITKITVPNPVAGYTYEGVYASIKDKTEQIIDKNGTILVGNKYFTKDNTILYAHWSKNQYTITFNQQGGTNGTTSYKATYLEYLPSELAAPVRKGFTFKGYYTGQNGTGTMYFNEYMNTDKRYELTSNLTLYAYWVDDIMPTGNLEVPFDWTNDTNGVKVDVSTKDDGNGLLTTVLNREDELGDVRISGSSTALGGRLTYAFTHYNTKEGIYVYRLTYSDVSNSSKIFTLYKTSKYDKTAPTGSILADRTNITNIRALTIFAQVSDFNVSN